MNSGTMSSKKTNVVALRSYFKSSGEPFTLQKGHVLHYDDIADTVFYITRGFIISHLTGGDGDMVENARYIFGPNGLLQTQLLVSKPRQDVNYTVLESGTMYGLPTKRISQAIKSNGSLATEFLKITLQQRAYALERVENLSYLYSSDKLMYCILFLAERFGVQKNKEIHISVPITHQIIGAFIKLKRENVSREMKKLIEKEVLSYTNHQLVILDLQGIISLMHETIRTDWHALDTFTNH